MVYKAKRDQMSYGIPVGVLQFSECFTAQPPGSVGNASTFHFPILYRPVEGLTNKDLYTKNKKVKSAIIEAAKALEHGGVRAITSHCGYFALWQKDVADAVDIPVFLSSLMQVPFLSKTLGKGKKIGILVANSECLDDDFLKNVGIGDDAPHVVRGLQEKPYFRACMLDECGELNYEEVCREAVEAAEEIIAQDPSIGILLLECTELPPYAHVIQERTKLPVFDYYTMIQYAFSGVVRTPFNGYM